MRLTSTMPLAVGARVVSAAGAPRAAQPRAASSITIDQLIDINPPSNPIWSRDSRRIVFTWERAGVANLYLVPAGGSAKPAQLTTDGVPGNVFWSPDSASLLFFSGASLMTLPLDGSGQKPRFADLAGRSPSVYRDGTKIVYLAPGGAIRVRSLVDGSDTLIATVTEPIANVTWINDSELALSAGGGGGQTIRHEQTPDYSRAKIN